MGNIGTTKPVGIKIAYIGGGSRNWAWELMGDLALEPQLSGAVRLFDIDFGAARANEAIGNLLGADAGMPGRWEYLACESLAEALAGADFVVISILPGTFDEMESDVHLPEQYGIYQSVGDTVGPAGVVRAMRAVPMFAEFAEAIRAVCPDAWVINYTNPMSACTGALYRVFPGIKAFGCCHEVFHSQRLLAKMLALEIGAESIDRREIQTNVIGVNHFTWIDRASRKTQDLMPLFTEYAQKYARDGFALDESDMDPGNCFKNMNRVCFDLFLRYHAIPAAGDRHIAEFMPPWYLKSPDSATEWGFRLTPVSYRKDRMRELLQKSARIAGGQEKFAARRSGEEGTEQIKALLGLSELATNVNLPNAGQAPGLPIGAVVETNALFGRDSLRPIFAGALPPAVNAMVAKHAANQTLLVEACVRKDVELAFSVFLNDSLMTLGIAEAEELFGRMLRNTQTYLPGWAIPD